MLKKLLLSLGILSLLVNATPASAASVMTAIETQIQGLLGALQDAPTSLADCVVPAAPLAFGSYGPEVKKLQIWLNQHGYSVVPAGKESQYFGPLTHFAMIRFQTAAGIRPISGFYGAMTMAEMKKRCVTEPVSLSLSVNGQSPEGGVIPTDASRVELLRFDIAGKGLLNSLVVGRTGASRSSIFDELYLYDGDVRLTPGMKFDKEANAVVFNDLLLPINGKKTLSVMADVAGTNETSVDGVEIDSVSAVGAQGQVSGNFPIQGGLFTQGLGKVGNLVISKGDGLLVDPVIGQSGVKIAEFRIMSEAKEDVLVRSIALVSEGSIDPSLLSNFTLKQKEETVAVASAVNTRGQILLLFNEPFILTPGSPANFALYADFAVNAEPGKTLHVYLKSPIDLYATGSKSGQGVRVLTAQYNNSAKNGTDASWLTVRGGVATFGFRGPAVSNYAAKQVNAELMSFSLKAEQNLSVREIRVMLTAGGDDAIGNLTSAGGLCNLTTANYVDIKLVDAATGEVLTRPQTTACTTGDQDVSQTLIFKDMWLVSAGQTRVVKVITDIAAFTPAASETIKATLLAFEREDIRNTDTGYYLGTREVVPQGNIVGATHRVHPTSAAAAQATTVALSQAESLAN